MVGANLEIAIQLFQLTHGLEDPRTEKNEPDSDVQVRICDNTLQCWQKLMSHLERPRVFLDILEGP